MNDREDLLAMARRHVEQGEGHVARQKALIAELDRDGHARLAVEARALLTTLETSLRLARGDLARIENEYGGSDDPDCIWSHLRPNTGTKSPKTK